MIKIPSTISKVETLSDGTIRLKVDCQELQGQDGAEILKLYRKLGVFVFSESDISEEDLKDLPEVKVEQGEKTPGQRLRGVLYRLWEQTKTGKSFDEFYRDYMSALCEKIKEQLN